MTRAPKRTSRASLPISRSVKRAQARSDFELERAVPRGHRFTFYRVGDDECAKCGKTRKEHKT